MNTKKLQKIRAKCVELLAIAEKRFQGKWEIVSTRPAHIKSPSEAHVMLLYGAVIEDENTEFIAACAGPAEAGWRSTIAAIDDAKKHPAVNQCLIATILSAWPDELL